MLQCSRCLIMTLGGTADTLKHVLGCYIVSKQTESRDISSPAQMREALQWLVTDATAADSLLVFDIDVSQHHISRPNEEDFFELLVKPLPQGCRLTCILDRADGSPSLILKHILTGTEADLKEALTKYGAHILLNPAPASQSDLEWAVDVAAQTGFLKSFDPRARHQVASNVVVISNSMLDRRISTISCHVEVGDESTDFPLDPHQDHVYGSLTRAFIQAVITDIQPVSYMSFVRNLRQHAQEKGHARDVTVSSSHVFDTSQSFSLNGTKFSKLYDEESVPRVDSGQVTSFEDLERVHQNVHHMMHGRSSGVRVDLASERPDDMQVHIRGRSLVDLADRVPPIYHGGPEELNSHGGWIVLEVNNLINKKRESLFQLLRERLPRLDLQECEGPRQFARVRVRIDQEAEVRREIDDLRKARGKRVDVKEIVEQRAFESPRD